MSASPFELSQSTMSELSPLTQLAIPDSAPQIGDLSTTQPGSGTGESWVDSFVQQRVLDYSASSANSLLLADAVSSKPVAAPLASAKAIEFDGSTVIEQTDPLTGAGIVAAKTATLPAYPGYLLQYVPGKALDNRPAVAQWQKQMQQRGWTITVDGLYGPQSDRVARAFQREKGLTADGIVGKQTWQAAFDNSTLSPGPVDPVTNAPKGTRSINAAGLNLIKDFEGLRLNSYRDAVGVWTIGYGHTSTAGPGQRITNEQATALLRQDVATFEKAVSQAVSVPITNNQFAALVSFTYNVGSGALNNSTLLRRLNAGDTNGAANEFLRWNRAGGQVLAGLTRRREAERSLFLS